MSDLGTQDDPIFKGRTPGGISCAEFVRAVRKHAISEKMARDNEAIADYAMSCLDEEALDWSETLSEEVRGDWSLLRPALIAEYRGTGIQVGSPSSGVIPKAMIPIPAAAPPIPSMQMLPSVSTPLNAIATAPVPPPLNGEQPTSQAVAIQASTPVIRRGRIRATVGSTLYYVIPHGAVPARCLASQKIGKAAVVEEVEADGIIEFRFTSPPSKSSSWLGMAWRGKSDNEVGNHALLFPAERLGSTVKALNSSFWEGGVSVVKCTRLANATLALVLGDQKGTPVIIESSGRGDFYSLCITNNIDAFIKRYAGEKPSALELVFEPL